MSVNPSDGNDNTRLYFYNPAGTKKDSWGYFLWTVYRNGRAVGTAECEYDSRGSNVITVTRECDEGGGTISPVPIGVTVCGWIPTPAISPSEFAPAGNYRSLKTFKNSKNSKKQLALKYPLTFWEKSL